MVASRAACWFCSQALLFCCTAVTAQDIWATKTNLPMNLNTYGGQSCAAVGSFFYIYDSRPSSTSPLGTALGSLMKYTPATDTWFTGAACAPPRVAFLLPEVGAWHVQRRPRQSDLVNRH